MFRRQVHMVVPYWHQARINVPVRITEQEQHTALPSGPVAGWMLRGEPIRELHLRHFCIVTQPPVCVMAEWSRILAAVFWNGCGQVALSQ